MPKPTPLSATEKAYFDTIRDKAPVPTALELIRMTLDGRDVAVIMTAVYDAKTAKELGMMPLALVVDDDLAARLVSVYGEQPSLVDPSEVDPTR